MRRRILSKIVILMMIISTNAFSQSEFLSPGQSGFGFSANWLKSKAGNGSDINFGFALDGKADLGFSYAKIKSLSVYSVQFSSHLLKSYKQPFNLVVAVSVAEQISSYKGSRNISTTSGALIPYLKFYDYRSLGFILSLGGGFVNGNEIHSIVMGGMSFFINGKSSTFFTRLSLSRVENISTVSIGLGLIFHSKESDKVSDFKIRKKEEKKYEEKKKKKRKKRSYYDHVDDDD